MGGCNVDGKSDSLYSKTVAQDEVRKESVEDGNGKESE